MKILIRISCAILTVVLMLSAVTACSGGDADKKAAYNNDIDTSANVASGTVASNSKYELAWDEAGMMAVLKDKASGQIWSTVPYKYYTEGGTSQNVNSGLNLTVSDTKTFQIDNVNGFSEALMNGTIVTEAVDNGVKATYYFDKYEISVPVVYTLVDEGIEISVDPTKIVEGEGFKVVSVTPAPFMCSAENLETGSYLVLPTGSGALMYTDERAEGDRKYEGEVYGIDGARLLTKDYVDEEAIRMPIYGAVVNGNALLSIIAEGAEFAHLEAMTGNSRTGYSNVSASFYVRGYDIVNSGIQALNWDDLTKIAEDVTPNQIKITYLPLKGEDADYVGMANRYKKYLADEGMMVESKPDANTYGISILGGVMTDTTVVGIPTKKLNVMTTFEDAKEMVEELKDASSMVPEVILRGYGSTGIVPGKIAGGFNFPGDFGSKKDREALEKLCADKGVNLFSDFDLIRFSKNGDGFTTTFDSAKSASLQAVKLSPVDTPLRSFDKDNRYRLVKRSKLDTAVDKLIKATDKLSVSGVSLSTLGSIAYSDYTDEEHYSKGNMAADVMNYIKKIQKADTKVATAAANAYAAAVSNTVYDVPVTNGGYYGFDETIPLYQMVFSGYKPLYCEAVNVAANADKKIMQAVSSGTRLSFQLIDNFDTSDIKIQTERFYGSVYEDNQEKIVETLKKYEPFYKAINGASIKDYEILPANVTKTVFDNGVVVYANHGTSKSNSPVGALNAYEVRWTKG